eukprot:2661090-Heterocapsa_arctica.AAC.1
MPGGCWTSGLAEPAVGKPPAVAGPGGQLWLAWSVVWGARRAMMADLVPRGERRRRSGRAAQSDERLAEPSE